MTWKENHPLNADDFLRLFANLCATEKSDSELENFLSPNWSKLK